MTNDQLYEKYPHIVAGSIEDVPRGQTVVGGRNNKIVSHGKIAIVKCAEPDAPGCLKTRIINVQDASQTRHCVACTRRRRNERRRARRRVLE